MEKLQQVDATRSVFFLLATVFSVVFVHAGGRPSQTQLIPLLESNHCVEVKHQTDGLILYLSAGMRERAQDSCCGATQTSHVCFSSGQIISKESLLSLLYFFVQRKLTTVYPTDLFDEVGYDFILKLLSAAAQAT